MLFLLIAVGLVLVAVAVLATVKTRQSPSDAGFAFESRGELFTPAERSFLGVLEQALAGSRYRVFGKVRLGDLVKPAKGLTSSKRASALNRINQKHVDFLICTAADLSVISAVELDDHSHGRGDRAERDSFVDDALTMSKIPVLRFPAKKSYPLAEVKVKLQRVLPDLEVSASPIAHAEVKISAPTDSSSEPVEAPATVTNSAPTCEKCFAEMVKRQAKNGPHAGKFFWACSTYPKCRNVIAIDVG
jgi:hypothetical protein